MRLLIFWFFFIGITSHGQTVLEWIDLTEGISWEKPSHKNGIPGFEKAIFSPRMKSLEGERITMIGYLLVLDGKQSVYLLSMNPMASCFFCGNGGPETVVDLHFKNKPVLEMDALISVEGILRLNEDDFNASYYQIEDASALSFN